MRKTLAFAAILSAASGAWAADRKVGKGAPYTTIQSAVDAAAPGDRILVGPGVYYEKVSSKTDRLQFIGKKAVWDGTVHGDPGTCLAASGDGISVQGFTFRNGQVQVSIDGARGLRLKMQ